MSDLHPLAIALIALFSVIIVLIFCAIFCKRQNDSDFRRCTERICCNCVGKCFEEFDCCCELIFKSKRSRTPSLTEENEESLTTMTMVDPMIESVQSRDPRVELAAESCPQPEISPMMPQTQSNQMILQTESQMLPPLQSNTELREHHVHFGPVEVPVDFNMSPPNYEEVQASDAPLLVLPSAPPAEPNA